jgi:Leucine-rich repeat (LRR) protein
MKKIILLLVLTVSNISFSQCQKCASIAEASKEPEKVKSLIINGYMNSEGPFTIFPKEIENFKNIEILYLSDQVFTEVPEFIGNLNHLVELSLAGGQLETVPNSIFKLKSLKELLLNDNNFSEEYLVELKTRIKAELPKTKVILE